ncbi:hydrolase YcaC domain protein [Apiospora saccharicola]|uniref:Hydrolase YcaC domain protein n=1 Tax=Apiospora saccharicola TaxID=335842 RepID=A0ABR1VNW6_9PEZI
MAKEFPKFKDLPLDKNGPHDDSWGLWGLDDQLGTLNHLTDEVVSTAATENIETGHRISLNWPMTGASKPRFPRKLLEQKMVNKAPLKHAHDDEWRFNSQCSSQWDGFRHYAYHKEALYYMSRTAEEFTASPVPNGIQRISQKGIAGRVVFIDWYAWATKHKGLEIDAVTSYAIPFSELIETLRFQGLDPDTAFRPGDILLVRSGYLAQYEGMDERRREELDQRYQTSKPDNTGLQPSRELLAFLWDNKLVAVAGDSRSFDVWPFTDLDCHLHEWLLAGWGMPIGELFYLEELARHCAATGRYTFFLASAPMNVSHKDRKTPVAS